MTQERMTKVPPKKAADPQEVEEVVSGDSDASLLTDIDDLLNEIDSVLEDQAILVDFRQRSGQ